MRKLSNYLVVDAYFTKKDFIQAILKRTGLSVIGRLRDDANLRYLYEGEQKGGKGRPKQYDGKVNWKKLDLSRFKKVYDDESCCIYDAILYAPFLKEKLRIAYVVYKNKQGKQTQKIYFSTDIALPAWMITKYYQVRFQEEFLIRDAKQFTGLQDCQAKSRQKNELHWNMALTSVNLAKVTHWLSIPKEERKGFSMSDAKILYHNQLMIDRFFSILPNGAELKKNNPQIKQLYSFGARAA